MKRYINVLNALLHLILYKVWRLKEETAERFPQTYNFCETVFNNKKEMRVHLKKHSYNSVDIKAFKYNCSECNFLRENVTTMVVHVSRKHSEKFECELKI